MYYQSTTIDIYWNSNNKSNIFEQKSMQLPGYLSSPSPSLHCDLLSFLVCQSHVHVCVLRASVAISSNFKFYLHSLGISVFAFSALRLLFSSFSFTFPHVHFPLFLLVFFFFLFYLGIQTCCILLCDRKLEQRRRRRRRLKWSPTSRITAISLWLSVCQSVACSLNSQICRTTGIPRKKEGERGDGERDRGEQATLRHLSLTAWSTL